MLRYLHDKLDGISSAFWDKNPSIYVACAAWGVGSIFLHQFIMSTLLLAVLWLLARHEGWRKGRLRQIQHEQHKLAASRGQHHQGAE
jgi:hypothetical protein